MSDRHEGVVVRVNPAGLGVVKDARSEQLYAFTFDQIRDYHGESPAEIGLRVGRRVVFYVEPEFDDEEARVAQVELGN